MKKFTQNITVLILAVILLSSCSTLKVSFPSAKSEKIDKVGIISTYVNIIKPVVPLINASITNGRINSISEELMPVLKENATTFRKELANTLKMQLNCEVIYGDELQNNPGFKEIKEMYNFDYALNRNDEHFPEIANSKNDVNPFEFKKGKIGNYFSGKNSEDKNSVTNTISSICKKINIDYIAVSNTSVMIAAGDLLTRDKIMFSNELYLFNKNGECIASGRNYSKLVPLKADEVESYQNELDKYSEILLPIVEKIAVKYKK